MGSAAQMSAGSQPLPPLPDLQSAAGTGGAQPAPDQQSAMASLVAGIAPVKSGVDMILQGVKQIVQSGVIPGAEQPCSQIAALATALLPMAAQQVLQPGGGGQQQAAPPPQGMQPVPGAGAAPGGGQ